MDQALNDLRTQLSQGVDRLDEGRRRAQAWVAQADLQTGRWYDSLASYQRAVQSYVDELRPWAQGVERDHDNQAS